MYGTFEIVAKKKGKVVVQYYTVVLYNGIANKIFNDYKKAGYKNIHIRLI